MVFSLLDPTIKQLEKSITKEERNRTLNILQKEIHIMKTSNVSCFCDRCDIIRELINKVSQ